MVHAQFHDASLVHRLPNGVAASRWLPVAARACDVIATDCAKGNARDDGHEGDRRLTEV